MRNDELISSIAVIAEPVRLEILRQIALGGEMRAKDILTLFDFTQPTLSHHMSVLEEHELVSTRREGRCVYYSINRKTFIAINDYFAPFVNGPVTPVRKEPVKVKTEPKAPAKPAVSRSQAAEEPDRKDKKKKDKDKKKKDKKKKK
ncbi:DNA-binding transcriptional regulator, ArsR family [Ruminococcaceae bacterium YRB3002]|nr:DNA-binding transcriptional regulator, ArsR family [Ruminococcaceae bacterium YRB3002]